MKILSAEEVRAWDTYTIIHEPIASVELMERAALQCVYWLESMGYTELPFVIYCGKGNNGGDGLAIARLLAERGCSVAVHILEFGHKGTNDFQINLARLHQYPAVEITFIQSPAHFHAPASEAILIDALFGTGLNRPLEAVTSELVHFINKTGNPIISIDMPSGMLADASSNGFAIVKATHTISFQCMKMAFLLAENGPFIGQVHLLDIGLHPSYYSQLDTRFQLVDESLITGIYQPRDQFAHKGKFGHAMLIAGSYGKMGAAILAAQSCLRTGTGLLTMHIPLCGYEILQSTVFESMVIVDANSNFVTKINENLSKYNAIGIGPGLGTAAETGELLAKLISEATRPLLIDADGLNLLSAQKELLKKLPPGSVLTPHPKEFERLFGPTANEVERIELALQKAQELNCVILVKGRHTFIATPDGRGFFNSTGNAGMATAGSGDVLTGILTGLLAQGYPSADGAILGVYLHGLAGDLAAADLSMEAMIAGDITRYLGKAFLKIAGK
jgi:ADP-dependent NAD(P)H-hydrate dehydratase / NAD(P)H-hydrate epimerase